MHTNNNEKKKQKNKLEFKIFQQQQMKYEIEKKLILKFLLSLL